jgi:hypothetical protein
MLLPGSNVGGDGRSHMEHLEDMMLMEAIRLSLAAEEERKRKADKEERKAAKKREKEEKKRAKAAAKQGNPYGSGEGRSGHSSASGSNLSLPSLAFGRKRGNSGASNLRVEASLASAVASSSSSGPVSPVADSTVTPHGRGKDKGKGIERDLPSTPEDSSQEDAEDDTMTASTSTIPAPASTSTPRPIPSPHQPVGPSHLRQMSSASSVTSSNPDSQSGSYTAPSDLQDPNASGVSLAGREDGDQDPSASTEPMFNFRSLAEVVGVSLEGKNAGRRLSRIEAEKKAKVPAENTADHGQGHYEDSTSKADEANDEPEVEHSENVSVPDDSHWKPTIPLPVLSEDTQEVPGSLAPPEVLITPETPALDEGVDESKQLGFQGTTIETIHQVAH